MANVKTLTVNSVILRHPETGALEQFYKDDEFEFGHWAVEQLGDHCFAAHEETTMQNKDLESLTNRELLGICEQLGVEPASNRKNDIIAAIRSVDDDEVEA